MNSELRACRMELQATQSRCDAALTKVARLRDTHRQVLTWMRQTDSAVPMADVIKILEAGLEATK